MSRTPGRVLQAWQRKRNGGPRTFEHTPRRYRVESRIFHGFDDRSDDEGQDA